MQKMICGELFTGKSVIKDACIVFDERIIDVGSNIEISERYDCTTLDMGDRFVMPGFVDSHTHGIFAGSREGELELKLGGKSYMEILNSGLGITKTIKETESASDDEILAQSIERVNNCLSNGTTTMEVKSGYGNNVEGELRLLRLIGEMKKMAAGKIDIIPTFLSHVEIYEGFSQELLDNMERFRGSARFFDVFMEAFSYEKSKKMLRKAEEMNFELKLHGDEFSDCGGAALGAEMDCVSVDHLIKIGDRGLKAMRDHGTVATLLPATSFSSFEEYANARKILDYGIPVALATDLNPNCYCENMQFVIQLACYMMHLMPLDALKASTLNGARALNLNDRGEIAPGKIADFIVTDCANYMELFSKFGRNHVKMVFKDGKEVVSNT